MRYFAYGSNLDPTHFADWCREHGYQGLSLQGGQQAALDDYELAFSVPSKYWQGAVGTIAPKSGAVVYGMLFNVSDLHADKIRHKEGVSTGLYQPLRVEVRLLLGGESEAAVTLRLEQAVAFMAAEDKTSTSPPPPSARWIETVVRGARAHGLPERWIETLERSGG
jgi:hypothetical protein